jgi:PRTRC genetic system ParB family protein
MQATTVQASVPLSRLIRGQNPRTFFDDKEMEELTESVRSQGILQAILVRPKGDQFEIVAGERRYRAAVAAFGPDYEIPAMIKDMSDEEADAAALVENIARANMSPTEEAAAAAKLVGRLSGDRDEAARLLGWSRATLDKRLALMNCSESVRSALNQRMISLGHAELLAALARDTQDKLLPVIIKEKKAISELKATIEQASSKLDAAIFDKKDCAECPHNSSIQTSMFAESVTGGSCTNPQCYRDKTEKALTSIADGLKDEYPVIRILRVGDNETRVKLEAAGAQGVGEEQAKACQSCSDFGAAVSALPQAMGKVFKGQCFNTACNTKKVAARIKADQEAAAALKAAQQAKPTDQGAAATTVSGSSASGASAVTGEAADKAKEPESKKAVSVNESQGIKTYREKTWRTAMAKEISLAPDLSIQYLIALCINGNAGKIDSSKLSAIFKKLSGVSVGIANLGEAAKHVAETTPEVRTNMVTLLAATAMEQIDVNYLRQLAKHHQLDLTKHWALNKEFLDLLTKSEIEYLATELGLDAAYGAGFKKLFAEKKQDLIDKLLKVNGFNYSAKIPKVLMY